MSSRWPLPGSEKSVLGSAKAVKVGLGRPGQNFHKGNNCWFGRVFKNLKGPLKKNKKETSTHNLWGPSVWVWPPLLLDCPTKNGRKTSQKKVACTSGGRASSCSQWWCNQAVSWHLKGAGQDGNGQMVKVSHKRGWFFLKPIDLAGLIFLLG